MTADRKALATPEMIAAAWNAWHERHGGRLGPGPAFAEAIEAALRAAIRPEGEAVAWPKEDLGDGRWADVHPETLASATHPAPAQVEAASLPAPGGAVKVKPLVWNEFQYTPLRFGFEALTGVGVWRVFQFDEGWAWWRDSGSRSPYQASADDAKTGAQADYESRIRAALATDASPSGESRPNWLAASVRAVLERDERPVLLSDSQWQEFKANARDWLATPPAKEHRHDD